MQINKKFEPQFVMDILPWSQANNIIWQMLRTPPVKSKIVVLIDQPYVLLLLKLKYTCGVYFKSVTNIFT